MVKEIDIKNLSEQEVKELAVALLNKIQNPEQGIGRELFNAIARLVVTLTPEAACLRNNPENGNIEIYLIRRGVDDSAYAGQWHIPGSAIRPGEELEGVFLRLEEKEIGAKIISKKFAFHFNNPGEVRGHFFSSVYICQLESGVAGKGAWFSIDSLPEQVVAHHKNSVIPKAVKFFLGQ